MFEQHLVILLVKLAVSASAASIMLRFGRFQRMLMREERTLLQRVQLALGAGVVFGLGPAIRVATGNNYQAIDLGLEGALLIGLVGGYVPGLLAGVLIAIPALFRSEILALPLFAAVGVLGGLLRDLAPSLDAVWRITPFFDYSLWRLIRKRADLQQAGFSLLCVLAILLCEAMRIGVATVFPHYAAFSLFHEWRPVSGLELVALYLSTLFATILPIKVWHNLRNERMIEAQQASLNEARLTALMHQINPHFLFNTLNSVASLIRTNPEEARKVVYKLSAILRRLLRNTENLTPLRDELTFIEDYLAIEMVRFGDKLRFEKEIEPQALSCLVPAMLLQPLVENSIKHGLSNKVGGGTIQVKAEVDQGRVRVIVEDDGVGIPEEKLATIFDLGIGVSNVNERLKVLFGEDYRMWIDSRPDGGTRTGIELPGRAVA